MKLRIFKADLSRKEKKVLTEPELEAQNRAQCLVERANTLRMEQDEEMRMLNTVGSSCGHVDDESLKNGPQSAPLNCCLLQI